VPGVAEVGGVHDAWASRPAVVGHAVAPVSPPAARAMQCGKALMPHAPEDLVGTLEYHRVAPEHP
jgi:hypothetical protein